MCGGGLGSEKTNPENVHCDIVTTISEKNDSRFMKESVRKAHRVLMEVVTCASVPCPVAQPFPLFVSCGLRSMTVLLFPSARTRASHDLLGKPILSLYPYLIKTLGVALGKVERMTLLL